MKDLIIFQSSSMILQEIYKELSSMVELLRIWEIC
jgi:hypothetical protein